jgi:hypothetical protein
MRIHPLLLVFALPLSLPLAGAAQAQQGMDCTCYASVSKPMRIGGGSEGLLCPRSDRLGLSVPARQTSERIFRFAGDTIIADCLTPTGYQPPTLYDRPDSNLGGDDSPIDRQ